MHAAGKLPLDGFNVVGEQTWHASMVRGSSRPQQWISAVERCIAPGTLQGAAFLSLNDALVLPLSGEMLAHERAAREAAQAAAAAEAAARALHEQRNVVKEEEQRLFRSLQDVRKVRLSRSVYHSAEVEQHAVVCMYLGWVGWRCVLAPEAPAQHASTLQVAAVSAGVAPSQLLSDYALWELVRLRPGHVAALAHCQGCSEVFIASHGQVGQSCGSDCSYISAPF
jgi:hypothetical protein